MSVYINEAVLDVVNLPVVANNALLAIEDSVIIGGYIYTTENDQTSSEELVNRISLF